MTGIVAALAGAGGGGAVNPSWYASLQSVTLMPGISSASVTFGPDGSASAVNGGTPPGWFLPATPGVGASWWVRITGSGTNTIRSGMVSGTWYALSSPITLTVQNSANNTLGFGTATVSFSTDGGATVATTGSLDWYIGYEP